MLFMGETNRMLLRLAAYAALGFVGLNVAETTGLIEPRHYFPSLPRFEDGASLDNLKDGAHWGTAWVGCIATGNNLDNCSSSASKHTPTTASSHFTTRISAKRMAEKTL
jgi:hypothetical protein